MKKLIFWIVWLILVIPVFLYYLFSDITSRFPPSCLLKTQLVYNNVFGRFILGKA